MAVPCCRCHPQLAGFRPQRPPDVCRGVGRPLPDGSNTGFMLASFRGTELTCGSRGLFVSLKPKKPNESTQSFQVDPGKISLSIWLPADASTDLWRAWQRRQALCFSFPFKIPDQSTRTQAESGGHPIRMPFCAIKMLIIDIIFPIFCPSASLT